LALRRIVAHTTGCTEVFFYVVPIVAIIPQVPSIA